MVRVLFFPEVIKTFKLTANADILIAGGVEGNIFVWNISKPVKLHQFSFGSALPKPSPSFNLSSSGQSHQPQGHQKPAEKPLAHSQHSQHPAHSSNSSYAPSGPSTHRQITSIRLSIDDRYLVINSRHRVAYYCLGKLKGEKSKGAFQGYYPNTNTSSNSLQNSPNFSSKSLISKPPSLQSLGPWKEEEGGCIESEVIINGMEIMKERIALSTINGRNMVAVVTVAGENK